MELCDFMDSVKIKFFIHWTHLQNVFDPCRHVTSYTAGTQIPLSGWIMNVKLIRFDSAMCRSNVPVCTSHCQNIIRPSVVLLN